MPRETDTELDALLTDLCTFGETPHQEETVVERFPSEPLLPQMVMLLALCDRTKALQHNFI